MLNSSEREETFDVPAQKDIVKRFKAVPGTMYSIWAIKAAEDIHVKITDNKGRIALKAASIIYYPGHSGVPPSLLNFTALIYDPNDSVKDPSMYKVGFAKEAQWLEGKTFRLSGRYYEDNGANNMSAAPACSYDDTFTFFVSKNEDSPSNLAPLNNEGKVLIKEGTQYCFPDIPEGYNTDKEIMWSIIDNIILFPNYNTSVHYGARYNTITRFTMDKIDTLNGTITFHIGGQNGYRKEVFVYHLVP